MQLFPAIDIHEGRCVRLVKGDFSTAHQVADDPLRTAESFRCAGATWVHMVDLDGAKSGVRTNAAIFLEIAARSGMKVQLGGGIRDRATLDAYLSQGISRCVLGSAALKNPAFVKEAVSAYGDRIAVGIDAVDGHVAAEGWTEVSAVDYVEFARRMEDIGVKTIIFTDVGRDGTLGGPNFKQLNVLKTAVSCDIIASGGVHDLRDIYALQGMGLYGAICGKSLYSGTLDLAAALVVADPERLFAKGDLIPAVVQEAVSGEVLMVAYMNRESLRRTLETGETWFWSRSRQTLWHKGETSGHVQQVVSLACDCDDDTLLVRVVQTGPACHTGAHSCFFKTLYSREG